MRCVALALLGACQAVRRARLDLRAESRKVGLGLARRDLTSRVARVGTVETKPDATDELLDVRLGQVGVGAGGTARRTVKARLDARKECRAVDGRGVGVQLDDLPKGQASRLTPCARARVAAVPLPGRPARRAWG